MNISRESFPEYHDISMKSNHENEIIETDSTSASLTLSSERSTSQLKSSENSAEENLPCHLKRRAFKQKSQSYQDLHSDYTKRRYQHVKSKVKEYIANLKANDRKGKTIIRHRSLPETIGSLEDSEAITADDDASKLDSNDNIVQLLHEKDMEVQTLRAINENLESNLQEKIAMLARAKMNADIMRIQVMEMKEKERRVSLPSTGTWLPAMPISRLSLPARPVSPAVSVTSAVTIATQTDIDFDPCHATSQESNHCSTAITDEIEDDESAGKSDNDQYSDECISHTNIKCNLRRRSNSNSIRVQENTENIIDSSNIVESCADQSTARLMDTETIEMDKIKNENKKRKKCKRISWRNVVLCCSRPSEVEKEFFYSRLPANDIAL